MTCGELRGRLERLRADALVGVERDSALRHLACCADCAALAAARTPLGPGRSVRAAAPLLLVACCVAGALVLARCGKAPGSAGTDVAKGPGDAGSDADAEAVQPPGPAANVAQPPIGETVTAPIGQVKEGEIPAAPRPINMPRTPIAPRDVGEPSVAPKPAGSPTEQPQPTVKWPDPPAGGQVPATGAGVIEGPTAPRPPPDGPLTGPQPPAPVPGATPGDNPTSTGPRAPATDVSREAPREIDSPKEPTPGGAPDAVPGAGATPDPARVRQLATILGDPDRGLSERVRAARDLGGAGSPESAEALLETIRNEPLPKLRQEAAEALGAMGGAYGQSALRRALEAQSAGTLDLVPTLAAELRRVGASAYLAGRLTGDLHDFSPRIRARGALGAGGGEVLALGARLVELLADSAVVGTGPATLPGRAPPGLAGPDARVEVRHAAWRGLTLLAQGADYGGDVAAWSRYLDRRAKELGATPTAAPAPPAPPGLGDADAAALLARLPDLSRALASRDPQVLDDLLYQLRTTLDFPSIADGRPGDAVAAMLRGLPKYATAAERDAACAPVYVEAMQRRDPAPLSAVLGLQSAGTAGRRAWVARMGAGGVARLVAALQASTADPEAAYRDGGALLRVLDGFRPGADPERPFCDRAQKDLPTRVGDAQEFAAAVAETGAWWQALGDGAAWDAASATIVGPKK